jgi:hypothetical protein
VSNHRRILGGALGLGLALVAAIGISGRNGFGENPEADVIRAPDREARVDRMRTEGHVPVLGGATGWFNSAPLTASALHGKVIVFEFGTFTCINWRRQLPYVRAWAERYASDGLVVVGVHTPEFGFEHATGDVESALRTMAIPFPVAIDSDYAIWDGFENMYWPALYFVDVKGRIRHHQFGEGDYEISEMVIRQLLAEAGHPATGALTRVDPQGFEAAPDLRDLLSAENYIGYARTNGFASPGGAVRDTRRSYRLPEALQLAEWALAGAWTMGRESAVLDEAGGRIAYRFHARDLHVVMGAAGGASVRVHVRLDGAPPGAAHGLDIDADGNGTIREPRLYQLIRQPAAIGDRELEIEFLDPGVELFSFTFG